MSLNERELSNKHATFYKKIRTRFNNWIEKKGFKNKYTKYLLLAPDLFHLLCKLLADSEVPVKKKAKVGAAIAYFILPLDAFPEAIFGPPGYLDDIVLSAYVLNDILNDVDEEVVLRHWAGEEDLLGKIQELLNLVDELLGSGLWEKVKKQAFS